MKWIAAALTALGSMLLGWFGMGQRARGRAIERGIQAYEDAERERKKADDARRADLDDDEHRDFVGRL